MKSASRAVRHAAVLIVVAASPLAAQATPLLPKVPQGATDQLLEENVFPPELVMQHQQKINLSPAARGKIREAMTALQTKVIDIQWNLQDEAQKLVEALQRPSVNEAETLAQVDRVLSVEREVKHAQMAMLIRIKNALTAEQQAMLRELRKAAGKSDASSPDQLEEMKKLSARGGRRPPQ